MQQVSAASQDCATILAYKLALDLLDVRRAADIAHLYVHQSKASARSSAGAECVSAPMEIQSTPVSAILRAVSSVTPPDASVTARPSTRCTASRRSTGSML